MHADDRHHHRHGNDPGCNCPKSTPDLCIVLMDIMMPEMDGYQTIGHIRKSGLSPLAHCPDRQGIEGDRGAWKARPAISPNL